MNYPMYNMQNRPTYMDILQQQSQYYGIKGRPVASYDEAKASMIDFDGSIFYFPDTANNRIYTKQINLDGTSSLKTYALVVEKPQQQQPQQNISQLQPLPDNLVYKEEFNTTIDKLAKEINELKGAISHANESSTKPTTTNDDATTFTFK